MTAIQHEFRGSTNPRTPDRCPCGRSRDEHPQPSGPTTRRRTVESEREVTREAARGLVDPLPLIEFSEARAAKLSHQYVNDPAFVQLRDRTRDAKEELADCRLYLSWLVEENTGTDRAHDAFLALRHVLLAYDLLCREEDA